MPEESGKSFFSSLPLPGLIAVITGLMGTLLLQYEPLTSQRPDEPAKPVVAPTKRNQIDATLYEDPFSAIARRTPEEVAKFKNRLPIPSFNPAETGQSREKKLPLIVPVFMKPGTDRVSSEVRSRTRLAVIQGLASSGYVPESGTLEYFNLKTAQGDLANPTSVPETKDKSKNTEIPETLIPFERFEFSKSLLKIQRPDTKRSSVPESVVVLWLPGEAMAEKPIATLRGILQLICPDPPAQGPQAKKEIYKVVALGPHSTGALLELAREIRSWPTPMPAGLWPHPIDLISHAATASDDFLAEESDREHALFVTDMSQALNGGKFSRTIMTDDLIAGALLTELCLRGIHPEIAGAEGLVNRDPAHVCGADGNSDHIAIISEFDTPYGRAFPTTFAKAAGWEKNPRDAFSGDHPKWHWFSYAKGLDGRAAGAPTPVGKPGDKEKSVTNDRIDAPGEIPDGPNQADALRRLAEDLRKLDVRLSDEQKGGIRAIGLMGGDVFDKLWLLRALKPHFPRAVFFTDNLDAWLWQRDELRSTRNLIVASPYGLSLSPKWQMGVPPFRDSYQTSVYAATLAATGVLNPEILTHPETGDLPGKNARVYEIGNQGPYDLSHESSLTDAFRFQREPEPYSSGRKFYWIFGISAAVALLGVAYWCLPQIGRLILPARLFPSANDEVPDPKPAPAPPKRHRPFVRAIDFYLTHPFIWIPVIIGLCAFLTHYFWRARISDGEPMQFLSGISGWPAQIFRIAAILLAVHLTGNIWQLLRRNVRKLDREYFAPRVRRPSLKKHRWRFQARVAGIFHWSLRCWFWSSEAPREIDSYVRPQRLWNRYRRYTGYGPRVYRSACIFIVLAMVLWLPGGTFGADTVPIRGNSSRHLNTILDHLSSAAFLWITAVVIDAMWTGRMFAYWMTSAPTLWEERAKKYIKGNVTDDAACDYLDLRIVADRTRPIVAFAFYPFYILALLILSRFECFDHWNWSAGMIAGYTIAIVLVVIAAQLLRYEAEKIRSSLISHLREEEAFPPRQDSETEILINEVITLKTGAFAPISEQPVMKGIYWLISALSVGGLWQYITRIL